MDKHFGPSSCFQASSNTNQQGQVITDLEMEQVQQLPTADIEHQEQSNNEEDSSSIFDSSAEEAETKHPLIQGLAREHYYVGTLHTSSDSEIEDGENGENQYQPQHAVPAGSSVANLLPLIVDSLLLPTEGASHDWNEERTFAAQDHYTPASTSGNNLILKFHFIRSRL